MINLQKRRDYEASLNNILHKAPLEAGVERVVITLLNDILDDLGKWPELSAEDTPKFGAPDKPWIPTIRSYYGLVYSYCPDGMILDNLFTYQQADVKGAKLQPRALIETKGLAKKFDATPQLTSYLDDLKGISTLEYVIWTNGLVWKIFFIENGTLKDRQFNLDKNSYGYIPDGYTGNIQIDQNEFNDLINYLKSILYALSTL